jgi:hypothetical protein
MAIVAVAQQVGGKQPWFARVEGMATQPAVVAAAALVQPADQQQCVFAAMAVSAAAAQQ